MTPGLSHAVDVGKALGHPARLRLLAMLREGELCVCQMTAVLRLAPSTVSAHLADLRRSGLVSERKDAKWVRYRLTDAAPLRPIVDRALALVEPDDQLRADARTVASLRRIPLETLCRAGLDLGVIGVPGAKPTSVGRPARLRRRSGKDTGV